MEVLFEKEGTLKNFLSKDDSICREERQFALFLYLVFLKKKRKETGGKNGEYIDQTVRKCLELEDTQDVEIIDVYYEASLMRDYWKYFQNNKNGEESEFNEKVLHFCLDFQLGAVKAKEEIDRLLSNQPKLRSSYIGQTFWQGAVKEAYGNEVSKLMKENSDSITDEEKQQIGIKAGLDIAKMMMNATPDILVVYNLDGRLYAKALECKYQSKEGKYQDVAGAKNRMQLFIQQCIMCFCFGTNGHMNEQKRHMPNPLNSPEWKNKENLWEETCNRVYQGILDQEMETGDIKNGGVQLIRFTGNHNLKEGEIQVELKELLENMY